MKYIISIWLIFDGVISCFAVSDKRLICQLGRIVRIAAGIAVLFI